MHGREEEVTAETEGGGDFENWHAVRGESCPRGSIHRLSWWTIPVSIFLIATWLVASMMLDRSDSTPTDLSAYPWLFLRSDRSIADDEQPAEVVLVGDVMLGRGVADGADPFAAAAPWLRAADLSVANLECVFGGNSPRDDGTEPDAGLEPLVAPPDAVGMLRRAGFDLLGLANNHGMDLGPGGLAETVSQLSAAGMTAFGVKTDADAEVRPVVMEARGIRLAFLAFNAIPGGANPGAPGVSIAAWDSARSTAAVSSAAEEADGVIVFIHWGYEYERHSDPLQRWAADRLLQAGADMVVGHHPHVVQGFQVDDGRCVAYSLGNFVFDQGWDETGHGLALRAFFDEEGLRGVQGLPVRAGPRPRLALPDATADILPSAPGDPDRLAFSCTESSCAPMACAQECEEDPPSGVFWGGRVDLTGDGIPEHVRRVCDRVIIYSDGEEVWRTPDTWWVEDVALGDPNDDGRRELVLALWKPGLDGLEPPSDRKEHTLRSRPFIIGYRGGVYRTLWGGSAVADPIHEVALGDVDGDGAEELLVLEAPDPGAPERRLAVWRWHGWGFSLIWRSETGRFSDLVVDPSGNVYVEAE